MRPKICVESASFPTLIQLSVCDHGAVRRIEWAVGQTPIRTRHNRTNRSLNTYPRQRLSQKVHRSFASTVGRRRCRGRGLRGSARRPSVGYIQFVRAGGITWKRLARLVLGQVGCLGVTMIIREGQRKVIMLDRIGVRRKWEREGAILYIATAPRRFLPALSLSLPRLPSSPTRSSSPSLSLSLVRNRAEKDARFS